MNLPDDVLAEVKDLLAQLRQPLLIHLPEQSVEEREQAAVERFRERYFTLSAPPQVQVQPVANLVTVLKRLLFLLGLSKRERAFVTALAEDRLDCDTIAVFADWLEEEGRTQEGVQVRRLSPVSGDSLVYLVDADLPEADRENLRRSAAALKDLLDGRGISTDYLITRNLLGVALQNSEEVEVQAVVRLLQLGDGVMLQSRPNEAGHTVQVFQNNSGRFVVLRTEVEPPFYVRHEFQEVANAAQAYVRLRRVLRAGLSFENPTPEELA